MLSLQQMRAYARDKDPRIKPIAVEEHPMASTLLNLYCKKIHMNFGGNTLLKSRSKRVKEDTETEGTHYMHIRLTNNSTYLNDTTLSNMNTYSMYYWCDTLTQQDTY